MNLLGYIVETFSLVSFVTPCVLLLIRNNGDRGVSHSKNTKILWFKIYLNCEFMTWNREQVFTSMKLV